MLKFAIFAAALATNPVQAAVHYNASVDCLAQAIITEAIGEPFKGQFAVGKVIINRSKEQNVDICKIINQPGQFSNIHSYKAKTMKLKKSIEWKLAQEVAKAVLSQPTIDPTSGATYFINAHYRIPKNAIQLAVIGNHKFYKLSDEQ